MSKTRRALWVTLALALVTWPLDILLGAMLPDVSVNPLPQCLAGMAASLLLLGLPAWLMRPWTSIRLTRAKSLWPGLLMAVGGALLLRGALSPVDTAWQRWLEIAPNPLSIEQTAYQASQKENAKDHENLFGRVARLEQSVSRIDAKVDAKFDAITEQLRETKDMVRQLFDRICGGKKKKK